MRPTQIKQNVNMAETKSAICQLQIASIRLKFRKLTYINRLLSKLPLLTRRNWHHVILTIMWD